MSARPCSRSGGFTIIELMVAMTIGLLLTVTIAQIFLGSRRTYSTNDDLSRMQENMRYTHDILNRTLRMAGYMSYPGSSSVTVEDILGVFPVTARALDGADGNGGSFSDVSVADSITVRYQGTGLTTTSPDGVTTDCAGNAVPPGVVTTMTYSVGPDPNPPNKGVPSLLCDPGTGSPVAVVSDVENMQILYGEETSGDRSTDRYVPRPSVTDMDRVVSLRIALLFRTPNLNVRSTADTSTYPLLAGTVTAPTGAEATRIRRTMTMTIALRNRLP